MEFLEFLAVSCHCATWRIKRFDGVPRQTLRRSPPHSARHTEAGKAAARSRRTSDAHHPMRERHRVGYCTAKAPMPTPSPPASIERPHGMDAEVARKGRTPRRRPRSCGHAAPQQIMPSALCGLCWRAVPRRLLIREAALRALAHAGRGSGSDRVVRQHLVGSQVEPYCRHVGLALALAGNAAALGPNRIGSNSGASYQGMVLWRAVWLHHIFTSTLALSAPPHCGHAAFQLHALAQARWGRVRAIVVCAASLGAERRRRPSQHMRRRGLAAPPRCVFSPLRAPLALRGAGRGEGRGI